MNTAGKLLYLDSRDGKLFIVYTSTSSHLLSPMLHTGWLDNPTQESTIPPSQGLRIWLRENVKTPTR